MPRAPNELAMVERFSRLYEFAGSDGLKEFERAVCGCDYGGTSWTTLEEARDVGETLALGPGKRLLEVGAGSGWPGLYLAKEAGCDVALIDLPLAGLRAAKARAAADRHTGACWAAVADGAALPFPTAWFDAIHHSDVLCCLPEKAAVLAACRRAVRAGGKMMFSVIFVSPDLSASDYEVAVASGPPFVAAAKPYPAMLREAGWEITDRRDVTAEYLAALRRLLAREADYAAELGKALGAEEAAQVLSRRHASVAALERGLLRREIFVAVPCDSAV